MSQMNRGNLDSKYDAKCNFPSRPCLRSDRCFRNVSRHTSWHFKSLLWLRALIHAGSIWKKSNVPEQAPHPPFFSSFFFFYLHKYKCTDLHNCTGTYTQARHPSHVILLGIMPMAKHVTYQKSLWDIARERGGVVVGVCGCVRVCACVLGKFCTFASFWELLVKCKYSTYTGGTKRTTTFICNVLAGAGAAELEKEKKKKKKRKKTKKRRDLWDLMWNCSKGNMPCLLFIV